MDEYDIERVQERCLEISNKLTSSTDYVSIGSLLKEFDVDLQIRPLLVEALIGQRETVDKGHALTMLLNSKQWDVTPQKIEADGQDEQLPVRLRNTIAHELAHTLEFHKTNEGYKDRNKVGSAEKKARKKDIRKIENRTERYSQYLLVSDSAIRRFLDSTDNWIGIDDLTRFQERLGVSRELLISRIKMLWKYSIADLYQHPSLNNLAIGVGRYQDGKILLRRGRFVFAKFDQNLFPDFVQVLTQIPKSKEEAWIDTDQLNLPHWPSGQFGESHLVHNVAWGTSQNPSIEMGKIQIDVEPAKSSKTSAFFYTATIPN